MESVEVAIVGGGPGGTAAALAAAENGADAAVFERGVPRADREELGPDSTDAAGMLDYWVDIMGEDPDAFPDDVVLQDLDRVAFVGPTERVELGTTGMDGSYPGMGFTFHRARMDDWLRGRAEDAGASYRVGAAVTDVDSRTERGEWRHVVTTADGEEVEAGTLILADGPQRQVTLPVLDRFLPEGASANDALSPPTANHIAYQEHRRFPADAFEPSTLSFWWGLMPGETAYPWVFPNDGRVARVGLTMPIGMDLADVDKPAEYDLLRPSDEGIPRGGTYVRRLLEREYGDEYDVESDFPLVEDRGKRGGTETYPISSTRPVESPVGANVAVVGGAMGTTSAFHEGGYHVAVRSGKIAGELAATGRLGEYNDAWQRAVGDEILRNVSFARMVRDYGPADWDRAFHTAAGMVGQNGDGSLVERKFTAGWSALKLVARYRWTKFGFRDARYVQIREDDYGV